MPPDFYVLLGVTPSATPEEIRQAYRLRARELHPDARPGDGEAGERFKAVAEAYRVLASPEARQAYDAELREAAASEAYDLAGRARHERHTQQVYAPARPQFALRLVPGAASIGRLTSPTRFYLLGELAPAHTASQPWEAALNLAVLMDRSSSMRGAKIFEAKRAVRSLFSQLGVDDRLTLLLFDDRLQTLLDGETPVGAVGAEMALDSASTRGSTQLAPALDAALNRLEQGVTSGRIAALLLITDGRTYGDDAQCLELAERARLLGTPIISFGLGLEWNRDLLDRIASVSGGSCAFVEEPAELSALLGAEVERLRATLAANIRLSLTPGPGVSVVRASAVAPEIADVFDGPYQPGDAVEVKLGALTTRPDAESVIALWEALLDPASLATDESNNVVLGTVNADWSLAPTDTSFAGRLSQPAVVPRHAGDGLAPLTAEARLALELLTAYRLHVQADQLASAGAAAEAAAALNTSSLRLRSAGDARRADEAEQAASALLASAGDGLTATLRGKYAIRNLGLFQRLRRTLQARLPAETP